MIDCFDGMPVTWTIGTSPDADLVNTMLDQAIAVLPPDAKPIVHSDHGCHYRWQGIGTKQFIPILNDYLIRYREKRIKLSLHGLSPIEYRRKSGLI